jgi:hypothetical protein
MFLGGPLYVIAQQLARDGVAIAPDEKKLGARPSKGEEG